MKLIRPKKLGESRQYCTEEQMAWYVGESLVKFRELYPGFVRITDEPDRVLLLAEEVDDFIDNNNWEPYKIPIKLWKVSHSEGLKIVLSRCRGTPPSSPPLDQANSTPAEVPSLIEWISYTEGFG